MKYPPRYNEFKKHINDLIKRAGKTTDNGISLKSVFHQTLVFKYGIDAVGPLELYQRRVWTDDELIADAKRFTTRNGWQVGNAGAYHAAFRRGKKFIAFCCAHMDDLRRKWTREDIMADAKRFPTRGEWYASSGGYKAARKRGKEFFGLCCAHMQGRRSSRLTDEVVLSDAKRFSTRRGWKAGSGSCYNAANKRGKEFFEMCCAHMYAPKNKPLTDEEILTDAKRFTTRKGWSVGVGGGYQAAKKRGTGFFELCCAHMTKRVKKKA